MTFHHTILKFLLGKIMQYKEICRILYNNNCIHFISPIFLIFAFNSIREIFDGVSCVLGRGIGKSTTPDDLSVDKEVKKVEMKCNGVNEVKENEKKCDKLAKTICNNMTGKYLTFKYLRHR